MSARSPYEMYCREVSAGDYADSLPLKERIQWISDSWKELSDSDRKRYEDLAMLDNTDNKDNMDNTDNILDLPYAQNIDTYNGIKVVTTDLYHDSGYRIMIVIGEKDSSSYILADHADVIEWTFSEGPWYSRIIRALLPSMKTESSTSNTMHYYGASFTVRPSKGLSTVTIEVQTRF